MNGRTPIFALTPLPGGTDFFSPAVGGPLPAEPWPALPGGDVPLNPFAQAVFARVGQQTAFLAHGSFYAEWDLSAAAVALGGEVPGLAADGWGLATSGARWAWSGAATTALGLAPATTLAARDFLAGWFGQYAPSWANTAGVAAHDLYQTVTCPPWLGEQCG